jgi:hypothetical protein
MPLTPEAKSVLATVAALSEFQARQTQTHSGAQTGTMTPVPSGEQAPAPDDGEDDEIPNEPKDD